MIALFIAIAIATTALWVYLVMTDEGPGPNVYHEDRNDY